MDSPNLTKQEKKEIRKLERLAQEKDDSTKKLFRTVGIWVGIIGVIVLSIFGLFQLANTSSSSPSSDSIINATPLTKDDIKIGNPKAKVVIVEYADFQCPACAAFYPIIKQLLADYDEKIVLAYRFFPLRQIHKNAGVSAQAAYAAYLQGKFSEMENLLYTNQTDWSESNKAEDIFLSYAKTINLNIDQYQKDFSSDETKKFIEKQENAAVTIGINSTPTIFVNGKQLTGPRTYDTVKEIVEGELKAGK